MKTMLPYALAIGLLSAIASSAAVAARADEERAAVVWEATRLLPAAEAHQAAAAEGDFVYAITNTLVAKYDRRSGQRVATSTGKAKHLNSGFFWKGKLYCAHSNYPSKPEQSQVMVLDPETMKLETCHDFADFGGSLTWVVRHDGHWWCTFAHYGKENGRTFFAKFDDAWREQDRWSYPPELVRLLGRYSVSGGVWRDGSLLVTDHDHRVLYRLELPKAGNVLELVEKQIAPFTGQGIAHDPVTGGLIGIDRAKRQIVFASLQQPMELEPLELIPRRLPPSGIRPPLKTLASLEKELARLEKRLAEAAEHPLIPDVEVYLKAVGLALQFDEFYRPQDADRATAALERGSRRLDQLTSGQTPWTEQRGLVVRGYRSAIDDSVQPYGLVIPENLKADQPVPLYVWLHGRGDKVTDLHFIHERENSKGQIAPPGAIVLHPFGRHCLGFKSAGEIDVLEAIEHVCEQHPIDRERIVLMGFSMGGAGAWHLGAHYTDRFAAISPGAGFAETARYINLAKEDYPPPYEQALWGIYDVPGYVRNLFNVPVVAYSGELDRQIQAARVMEEAFAEHGRRLTHVIGPGTEHKYHPESLENILRHMDAAVKQGRPRQPHEVTLQTRTLRYNRMLGVEILGLARHWQDSRVDAKWTGPAALAVATSNVTRLRLHDVERKPGTSVTIDGQATRVPDAPAEDPPVLQKRGDAWTWHPLADPAHDATLAKRPGLQGPIDDAFLSPFLVVVPSGRSPHPLVERWVGYEFLHFNERWQGVFRGRLRMKQDRDVTDDDLKRFHIVAWGDPHSNRLIERLADRLPIQWSSTQLKVGPQTYNSADHAPLLIYPNPLAPDKYLVINSGPTFRAAHDRTNSLQNPKLPDWAVIDLKHPPTAESPGKVQAADFFGESWELR